MSQRGKPKRRGAAVCRREASSIRRPPLGEQGVSRYVCLIGKFRIPGTQRRVTGTEFNEIPAPIYLPKSIKNASKISLLFLLIFNSILAPKIIQFGLQNVSKIHSKSIQIFFAFFIDFWLHFGRHFQAF
jgi:hypothetical protein